MLIEAKGLRKQYGKVEALAGVDFAVDPGETVVLMGPSGCGKSTLVRCLNRLTEPDSGELRFCGQDLLAATDPELQKARRQMGFVFQHFNLISRLTALENVSFPLLAAGVDPERALARAESCLEQVGVAAKDSYPHQLSGGQQQRVGIARALVTSPRLMIWDEPTASLDPIIVDEVLVVMEELVQAKETTMVIVTHEVPFALEVADRIVLMDQGRIVEEGAKEQIFRQPQSWVGVRYRELLTRDRVRGYCQGWQNMA